METLKEELKLARDILTWLNENLENLDKEQINQLLRMTGTYLKSIQIKLNGNAKE